MELLPQPALEKFDLKILNLLALTNKTLKEKANREIFNKSRKIYIAFESGDLDFLKKSWLEEGSEFLKLVYEHNLNAIIPKDKLFILDWLLEIGLEITYSFLFRACYLGRLDILKWADNHQDKFKENGDIIKKAFLYGAWPYLYSYQTNDHILLRIYANIALEQEHILILDWVKNKGGISTLHYEKIGMKSFEWAIQNLSKQNLEILSSTLIDPPISQIKLFIQKDIEPSKYIVKLLKISPRNVYEFIPKYYTKFDPNLRQSFEQLIKYLINDNRIDLIELIDSKYFYGGSLNDAISTKNIEAIKVVMGKIDTIAGYQLNNLLKLRSFEIDGILRNRGLLK